MKDMISEVNEVTSDVVKENNTSIETDRKENFDSSLVCSVVQSVELTSPSLAVSPEFKPLYDLCRVGESLSSRPTNQRRAS